MIDVSEEQICFVMHRGTNDGLGRFLGVLVALLVISPLIHWSFGWMWVLVLMKRAAFCLPVFRIRWIHSCLFEKARRIVWPQRRMCPLALQFLVFRDGGTQCIVNHGCLAQQWVITLQKEWGEERRRGRERWSQKLGRPERFLPAEMRFALRSPGFYLLDNQAPHWRRVLHERLQEKTCQHARDTDIGQKDWKALWRLVRVCICEWASPSDPSVISWLASESFGLKRLWNITLTRWEKPKGASFHHSIFFLLTSKFFPNSLKGRCCKRLRCHWSSKYQSRSMAGCSQH